MSRDQRDYLLALLDPCIHTAEVERVPVVPPDVARQVEGEAGVRLRVRERGNYAETLQIVGNGEKVRRT